MCNCRKQFLWKIISSFIISFLTIPSFFFISFYTIHICYITNVYGAADIEIERLSGGFKQAQTHTNIILEEREMNIYIECEKIYIKGIFSSIGSQNTFIVLYSCIYM